MGRTLAWKERNAIGIGRKRKGAKQKGRAPLALKPGDTIAFIAPASAFESSRLYEAKNWFEARGYHVEFDPGIFSKDDYLAGSDERRAKEFLSAWKNPNVKAVFCARGGYGVVRMLESISLRPMTPPKLLMGLSDLTLLINLIAKKTGITTVHGPVIAGDSFLKLEPDLRHRLFEYLERSEARILRDPLDFKTMRSGTGSGQLWGGNLSLIQSTLGTRFEIPFSSGVLFLEDVNEPKYRIDRMFAHLHLAGVFKRIKGLLLGQFLEKDGISHDPRWLERLVDRYVPKKIPVLSGIKAGHGKNEVWLPIGGVVRISEKGRRLSLPPLVRSK